MALVIAMTDRTKWAARRWRQISATPTSNSSALVQLSAYREAGTATAPRIVQINPTSQSHAAKSIARLDSSGLSYLLIKFPYISSKNVKNVCLLVHFDI